MVFKGFFTDKEIEKGTQRFVDLDDTGPNCNKCGMYKHVKSPKMKYTGEGKLNALIIGEAPGGEEDQLGKQFVKHAQAGGYLWDALSLHNLDVDRDFWKVNAVNCRPVKYSGQRISNRTPDKAELINCRPIVEQTIRELNPKFILLMGTQAIASFYLGHFKQTAVSRWRGLCIPDQRYSAWVLPLFHPSYITRDSNNKNLISQYARDIANAVHHIQTKKDFPIIDYDSRINCLYEYEEIIRFLDWVIQHPPEHMEFDYETTGLKPFQPGHKIVSISMCFDSGEAVSFPLQYQNYFKRSEIAQIKRRIRTILTHQDIKKHAHNIQFEDVWTSEMLGVSVENWHWDSMIAAHIIDNRSKFTGLKFQTYVNFGYYPYDGPVGKYIKGFPFNKMDDCPLEDLLHYGGLDALFGRMLYEPQKEQIEKEDLTYPYDFFHQGTLVLGDIQRSGICTDEEYYNEQANKEGTGIIDRIIVDLFKTLLGGKDAAKFKEVTGKDIDLESPKDLGILIYDILNYPKILTAKGNPSVDEKALNRIDLYFVKDLLRLRKMIKVKGTYLSQFKRFSYDGMMHPSYGLNIPISYRGSSYDPNFQNIPKRDDFSKKTCRKGIKPRPGRGLLSSDFSGIEVGISACYNKDPQLIKYISDPSTDMHRDAASDIWMLPKKEVTKKIRYSGKNGWVFPQFYGSYYGTCAPDLWDNYLDLETDAGDTLEKHLARKGIQNVQAFTEHCKKVEKKFWGSRFKVYAKWKEDINKEYRKNGFITSYLGFKYQGYMTQNECTNYQTQGTAFHMLLWSLMKVNNHAIDEGWESFLVGQIHDDMIHDYTEEELPQIIETINYYGTEEIRDRFKWIIVPLSIEHEVSGIDGNWAEMEEYNG